jgi:hypothetical protein
MPSKSDPLSNPMKLMENLVEVPLEKMVRAIKETITRILS